MTAHETDLYPVTCGWCSGPVLSGEGWILHGWGVCRLLIVFAFLAKAAELRRS